MASDAITRPLEYEGAAVDKISSLPTSLMDLILERLPTHNAARTSILSKTWRNVWRMHPRLHLDEEFFEEFIYDEKFSELDEQTQMIELSRTITGIFSAHSGPILDFLLWIPEALPINQSRDMVTWIRNISDSGVRKLKLLNESVYNVCAVPSHFFSCSQLTHLTLMNCELNPPLGFGGFCNLISVELKFVTVNAYMSFGTQLEELDMEMCAGLEHLRCQFNCENNLTSLRIVDCDVIYWEWFECIQKLQVLILGMNELPNTGNQVTTLDNLVLNMPGLNSVFLNGFFLKMLKPAGAAAFSRLTRTMENLKYLDLHSIELYELVQIQHVLCLVRSSPNLQLLNINLLCGVESSDNGVDLLDLAVLSDHMVLDRLETIMIDDLVGSVAEFQLIKLLLVSSPSLKWIKLKTRTMVNDPTNKLRISEEVLQIPRASKSAQIQLM